MLNEFLVTNRYLIEILICIVLSILLYLIYNNSIKFYKFKKYLPIKTFSLSFLFYSINFLIRIIRIVLYKVLVKSQVEYSFLSLPKANIELFSNPFQKIFFFSLQFLEELTLLTAGTLLLFSIYNKVLKYNSKVFSVTLVITIMSTITGLVYWVYLTQLFFFVLIIYKLNKNHNKKQNIFIKSIYTLTISMFTYLISWVLVGYVKTDINGYIFIIAYIIILYGFSTIYSKIKELSKSF
jgi:hypothetical protein